MSSDESQRAALLEALMLESRKMSAYGVLLSHTVAERVGIHPTDLECADMLNWTGPITAGKIAGLTGLTTGAVTALINRLERAGFVRRARDPDDKRRVIVHPIAERQAAVAPFFAPLVRAMMAVLAHYDDRELALILDFARQTTAVSAEEIAKLRARNPAEKETATQ
ncbi:MAG: MarR family winged helix-turn-helix transcriptional regulator [Thermomicrobiales bacterium]